MISSSETDDVTGFDFGADGELFTFLTIKIAATITIAKKTAAPMPAATGMIGKAFSVGAAPPVMPLEGVATPLTTTRNEPEGTGACGAAPAAMGAVAGVKAVAILAFEVSITCCFVASFAMAVVAV